MIDADQVKRERARLALEADRLSRDETLLTALATVRQNAVDALIGADATVTADIIRFQTKVTVCDEFMSELKTMVELQIIETGSRISG
jgi:hypothetical protein